MAKKKRGIPKQRKQKEYLRETTRLNYHVISDEISESSAVLLGSEIVIVQINRKDKTFKVVDAKTKKLIFIMGNGNDVEDCKRKARERLMYNSASLYEEVRK